MSRQALDELKQQIPLLDYLQAHDWQPARHLSSGRVMGLCPLHSDHKPSFLVDPGKGLFYCYGCGRGGDVIRFAELYHQVKFPQALELLHQWRGLGPLLHEAASFYRMQLHRHGEAVAYLRQRGVQSPELIERMAKMNPMERLGTTEDIASVVAFLVGPDGGWINGQVLRANGGMV